VILVAVITCEVGFWVVLAAGLVARYPLRRRRLGAVLLACVPVVDLALLVLTIVDLQHGARAEFAHGLAAVYLGFSVVFGHSMVRWADSRFAHRFAGGPAPEPKPLSGTWPRVRREWREFAMASVAVALSATLLLGAIAVTGSTADTTQLRAWLPRLVLVLLVWLIGWPLRESGRALIGRRAALLP
jgi:hypothetical protein